MQQIKHELKIINSTVQALLCLFFKFILCVMKFVKFTVSPKKRTTSEIKYVSVFISMECISIYSFVCPTDICAAVNILSAVKMRDILAQCLYKLIRLEWLISCETIPSFIPKNIGGTQILWCLQESSKTCIQSKKS